MNIQRGIREKKGVRQRMDEGEGDEDGGVRYVWCDL